MDTKLTLKLNKSIIDRAKEYAKERNISLSKMIENYLSAVTDEKEIEIKVSPLVESLIGITKPSSDSDKKDYTNYLSDKYA